MDISIIREFEDAAGKDNCFTDSSHLSIYNTGSIDIMKQYPEMAIRIDREDKISKIMKIAYKHSIPVVARGSGSSPTGAVVPPGNGIVLDLKPLNGIKVSYEDGFVEAYAGATLKNINEECGKYGFMFPPDPSSISSSTAGGAINENSGGMRCARYGVVKDWLLKVDVVLADGTETTFGEAIYKNRGGYNIIDIICGSEGTLCIVKKAWFKIIAKPKKIYRIAGFYDNAGDAFDAILKIRKLNPLILEYSDYFGIKAANKVRGFKYPETKGGMVLVDTDYSIDYLNEIQKIFEEKSSEIIIPKNDIEFDNIFEVRRIAFTAPALLYKGFIDGDIVVPLSKLKTAIEKIEEIRKKYKVYISTCGHAGDGNLHPQVGGDPGNKTEWDNVLKAVEEINMVAIELNGSISGEHGIGRIKKELFIKQLESKNQMYSLEFMKSIKKVFDPKNILNRENFFDI
jgi:glycolate oxidase